MDNDKLKLGAIALAVVGLAVLAYVKLSKAASKHAKKNAKKTTDTSN